MQEDLSTQRFRLLPASVRLGLSLTLGMLALLLLVGLLPVTSSALARASMQTSTNLDPSFGTNGVVTTAIGYSGASGQDVAIQGDGKIVVVGFVFSGSEYFAVVRYTASGALDSSFGNGGVVTTPIGSIDALAWSVAIQDDGKIVLAGYARYGGLDHLTVARYTTSGGLDPSFGTGGVVSTPIGSVSAWAWTVAIQDDGKIVAAGDAATSGGSDFAVVRYTTGGVLDASFGTGGVVTTPVGSGRAMVRDIAIQEDGGIVAAGTTYSNSIENFALARYTVTGALDASFGTGGIVITPIGTSEDGAEDVAIQEDGRIVAAGSAESAGGEGIAVVRYTTAGSLDTTFYPGGFAVTPLGNFAAGCGVAIQGDGKIVAVGETYGSGVTRIAVVRHRAQTRFIYLPLVLRGS